MKDIALQNSGPFLEKTKVEANRAAYKRIPNFMSSEIWVHVESAEVP